MATSRSAKAAATNLTAGLRRHPVATVVVVAGGLAAAAFLVVVGLNPGVVAVLAVLVAAGALALHHLARRRIAPTSARAAGWLGIGAIAASAVAVFALIQLVPYGRDHTNPPVTGEPQWSSPRTRELMVDACYSCHSSETEYPSYASVAPLSWAVQRHIDEGREAVNYSQFATDPRDADETVEVVEEGEMPPASYTRFGRHPEANLTAREVEELVAGLRATPGMSEDDSDHGGDEDGD